MKSFVKPKTIAYVGCWNVRTMMTTGKTVQISREMKRYHIDVLGLSEIRWTGTGRMKLADENLLLFAGEENDDQKGVGIMISKDTQKSLMEWNPISSRIITARFYSRFRRTTIIQTYAPTNEAAEEDKDEFYHQLQTTLDRCNKNDIIIIMGDLNAKVGNDNANIEQVMGKQGTGTRNENGERLCDFCHTNGFVITGTCFKHKDIHKVTWTSPDGITKNQIDHILIKKKYRTSVEDTRVYRGADAATDHYLVKMTLHLKLHRNPDKSKNRTRFDNGKLIDQTIKDKFNITVSNRFSALSETEDINTNCDQIERVLTETAQEVLGRVKKKSKQWLSTETWTAIDERRKINDKINSTRSERVKKALKKEYSAMDKTVKRKAREDKRKWLEDIAGEAEKAAENGRMKDIYAATNVISNRKTRQSKAIKNKNGQPTTDTDERKERWAEYFEEILNRDTPDNPIQDSEVGQPEIEDIDVSEITEEEIRRALRKAKNGKAPGIDEIPLELLNTNNDTTINELGKLFKKIWNEEKIPDKWKKGIIIKLPKKGDLTDCRNWRGITLLTVMSKIMSRVIINRIQNGIDKRLRKEQAGFRSSRNTVEQIFILRNIVEQVNEWKAPLYLHFVDFEKAFDSVHRESLWKIMKIYGIPDKLINMTKILYEEFQCSVLEDGELTRWFKITRGVKQGCVMSGFLFLLVIDWVMRKSTEGHRNGIRWNFTTNLEDLDFADDVVLLASKHAHIQDKTNRLVENSARVGLKLNIPKCKVMTTNTRQNAPVTIGDTQIENVQEFTYLGATIGKDGGGTEDLQNRLHKAKGTFYNLSKVWRMRNIGRNTKVKLFKTLVRSVLLYGCEAWKITKTEEKKIDSFQFTCLRRILGIRWPQKIRNDHIEEMTGINKISEEIRRRQWNWIGHVLRREPNNDCRVALDWRPEGRRAVGRPKNTWRRTVEKERKKAGWSGWNEVRVIAQDRAGWKSTVAALCASWH